MNLLSYIITLFYYTLKVMDSLLQEKGFLKEHLDAANEKIKAQDQSVTGR